MRVTYNETLDVLTVRWSDAEIVHTEPAVIDRLDQAAPGGQDADLLLDFDNQGRVCGLELTRASTRLAAEQLRGINYRVVIEPAY